VARFRAPYSEWEDRELQGFIRNALSDVSNNGGGGRYPWLPIVFPEYTSYNEGGAAIWNPNADIEGHPVGPLIDDAQGLRARVARAGGFAAIGFHPEVTLRQLQAAYPGLYVPDAQGFILFDATPNKGDTLGTAVLVTGIVLFTAGAATGFGIAAAGDAAPALTSSEITGAGATTSESFVGPATGQILGSGVQASGAVVTPIASAAAPDVIGVATGGGAFLDAAGAALPAQGAISAAASPAQAVVDAVKSGAGSALKSAVSGKFISAVKSLFKPAQAPALQSGTSAPSSASAPQLQDLLIPAGLIAFVAWRVAVKG
jgi:hypothetical protein